MMNLQPMKRIMNEVLQHLAPTEMAGRRINKSFPP